MGRRAQCQTNAQKHVANTNEVAVMGTYNSGCAKIEVPVLNQAPNGPMLMVSHANTNVGLTKTWDAGEPDKYYPTGKRNYARVVTTDDVQGAAAAIFAGQTLGVKKCYVLNDNETYGQGVAKAFQDDAAKNGHRDPRQRRLGREGSTNYTALFQKIKAAGADCVFLGGIYDNNGGQLVKDKVAVLGDNTKVKLIAPGRLHRLPRPATSCRRPQGMYLTFAGLTIDQLLKRRRRGRQARSTPTRRKYGKAPSSNYALYGVAAMQVILGRDREVRRHPQGRHRRGLHGAGITIPADESVLGKEHQDRPGDG